MSTPNIDEVVRGLFTKLNERKEKVAELKEMTSKGWKTTGVFHLYNSSVPTNIQTAPLNVIEEVAANVCLLQSVAEDVKEMLGTAAPSTMIQGFTVEDWKHDLRKRVATINIRHEEKQLLSLESRLGQVLSPEERRRIEVEMLAKEL